MYLREIEKNIKSKLYKGRAIIVIGPRQVGKTTLIKKILDDKKYLFLNCDDPTVRTILEDVNTEQLRSLIGNYKNIFIDEAQRIKGIGITLKIITDQFKGVQLFVSGSSAFSLSNELNEPLTGRKWEYTLLPISWREYEHEHDRLFTTQQFENRLIYGNYPDVLNNPGEEKDILYELVNSYLYRDLFSFSDIRKPDILEKLVRALALQIGSEVNYNELAQTIGADNKTLSKYIDVLEQGFILFRLSSFSRNLRNEIKKNKKIYFYDIGIRNAIIGNFSELELRQDYGALWENFLILERKKYNIYNSPYSQLYFWRTKQQQEVDMVEEINGKITGYEFKWNNRKKAKKSKTFIEAYSADVETVNRDNFRDFLHIEPILQ